MNILLNDPQRELYKDSIKELETLCPETISRKIKRANIQQAFIYREVEKLSSLDSKILCVGSFEDTAFEILEKRGYDVYGIDPAINLDLNTFFKSVTNKYDTIFSTSVIEHVEDDELFLDQICKLLNPGGYGILTCDFNNEYAPGKPKPTEDYRLYTKHDLLSRLYSVLDSNNCDLYGYINYDSYPDFKYSGCIYSFATYVFKKNK